MRIHVLGTRGFPSSYGGFETMVRHLAPYLVARGHEVTVFDRSGATPETAEVRTVDGVRVYPSRGLGGRSSSTLSHGLFSALVTAAERPDAALVMNVANGFFLPALRVRGVPVVLNVDGIEWERAKWSPLGKRVFHAGATATAKWADNLVADSEAIAARWRAEFGRESTFIPYGGDPPAVPPAAERVRELGLRPGGYVVIVARLVPENNVELMLAAARRAELPTVVVGSDSGSELELRVRAAHDPPRVHMLGHVADQDLLAALWAHCAVYLHGHSVGGTNPALVQAMGLGAPVLALDTPFNREVVACDEMVVPAEVDMIASRALALWESPGAQASNARRGQARVREIYNWGSVCAAYESLLAAVSRTVRR